MSDASSDGLWTRRIALESGISLVVEEEFGASIGGTLWEGGVLLANYLAHPTFAPRLATLPPRSRALELGAGVTGLPSLVAAILAARTGSIAEVITSDVDECLDGLAASVRGNAPPGAVVVVGGGSDGNEAAPSPTDGPSPSTRDGWDLPASVVQAVVGEADEHARLVDPHPPGPPPAAAVAALHRTGEDGDGDGAPAGHTQQQQQQQQHHHHPVTVRVMDVDWAAVPSMVGRPLADGGLGGPPFQIVLVADCCYYEPAQPALVAAMRAASAPGAIVLLAFYERSRPAAAAFWPRLRAAFDVTPIPASTFGCAGADAPSRPDGTGPPVGVFDCFRVSDEEYEAREAARVAAGEEEEGEEEEGAESGDE